MRVPESPLIDSIEIPGGADAVDDRIVELVEPGDLVVTADIPLANRVVDAGATALDPRGTLYTARNVKDKLATRHLMATLRDEGVVRGGPSTFSPKDRQAFANTLDTFLSKR